MGGRYRRGVFDTETLNRLRTSYGADPVRAPTGGVVGVDLGVAVVVALSAGDEQPAGFAGQGSRGLLRLQRRLARARRGSKGHKEMNTLIGQLKAKDAGRRKDWMKKTTTDLACRLDVIRVENLSITAMTRSARGCCPGTGQAGLPTRPLHPRFGSS